MMIKITISVSMLIAASTVGWSAQKASAKKTALSESELRAFAKAVPNVTNGGTQYFAAMATSNDVNRQQQLLKAHRTRNEDILAVVPKKEETGASHIAMSVLARVSRAAEATSTERIVKGENNR